MQGEAINDKARSGIFSGLIGGTLSLTVSAVIVKLIGLVYKIPIASLLGDEGMGYYNSAYTVYAFFYLLCTAGVPKAVMILISEAKARERLVEEGRILRVATILFLSVGSIATVLFLTFAAPIANLIGNHRSYFSMIAIAPSIVMVSVAGVIRGYLSANTRLLDISVSQIIEGVGKLALGLLFAMVGRRLYLPLETLAAFTILGVTFGSLLGLVYLLACNKSQKKRDNIGQNVEKGSIRPIIKRILKISVPITLSAAIMSLTNLIDLGLIMRSLVNIGYSEEIASALYGNYTTLAVPMLNLATSVIAPISIAFLPVFTRCSVTSDRNSLVRSEKSAIELTALLSAPMMIGLTVYAREILRMLFPSSETETGAVLLSLIAPAIFFSSILMILNTLLEAHGMVKAPLISMSIGGIVKVAASYIFITKTDLGILGAPIGTVLSYAVALLCSTVIYGRKFKKHIPIFESSALAHFYALGAVLLSRIVYQRLVLKVDSESLSLMMSILLAALIYLGFSAITGLFTPKKIGELAKYTNLS